MTIESGTTADRRNRILIFTALLALFTGWFGYDGFVGYPAKNMKWAHQNLATGPDFPQPEQLKGNPQATLENLKTIRPGTPITEVRALLGEPTHQKDKDCYYIGRASFGWFIVEGDRIAAVKNVQMNPEPSEKDIANQKRFASVTGAGALLALIFLVRVLRSRTVLDEQGLRIGGKLIGWDDMRSLDASQYARKGWLNLEYAVGGGTGVVRLDSFHIDLFDEIVTEICRRKGFTSPLAAADADKPAAP